MFNTFQPEVDSTIPSDLPKRTYSVHLQSVRVQYGETRCRKPPLTRRNISGSSDKHWNVARHGTTGRLLQDPTPCSGNKPGFRQMGHCWTLSRHFLPHMKWARGPEAGVGRATPEKGLELMATRGISFFREDRWLPLTMPNASSRLSPGKVISRSLEKHQAVRLKCHYAARGAGRDGGGTHVRAARWM